MRRFSLSFALAAAALLCAPSLAWAIAGFSPVASEGQKVGENKDWPAKLLEVVNDPARTVGWNFWFSECPNDVNHYVFVAKSTDDLKGTTVSLALGKEFPVGGFSFLKKGNNAAAVLAVGNQARIDQWYVHLKPAEGEPGVKKFGINRYTEPPKAMPPTLTIYVENPAVIVDKLIVPAEVTLSVIITSEERAARKEEAILKSIDALQLKWKQSRELQ